MQNLFNVSLNPTVKKKKQSITLCLFLEYKFLNLCILAAIVLCTVSKISLSIVWEREKGNYN